MNSADNLANTNNTGAKPPQEDLEMTDVNAKMQNASLDNSANSSPDDEEMSIDSSAVDYEGEIRGLDRSILALSRQLGELAVNITRDTSKEIETVQFRIAILFCIIFYFF